MQKQHAINVSVPQRSLLMWMLTEMVLWRRTTQTRNPGNGVLMGTELSFWLTVTQKSPTTRNQTVRRPASPK
ncbi:hypothetical protein XENOCAPTIV_025093 [Xenoophorus captivus]|uniref:Secreted protein n=1 Tax=Xenoophorus captivus TaxID=1517983 RepID=A0ABV0QTF2_9TELE